MARLVIQMEGAPDKVLEILQGPQRVGRTPENDIVLLHPSVSSQHCILQLCDEGLLIRDLGSTNGTDLDGEPVLEAFAQSGQAIQIGVFNCVVEDVVPKVTIPKWEEAPPPELPAGVKPCFNHPEFPASMECTECHKLFCGACVHLMRMQGGVLHRFCPVCSHKCVAIEGMNTADSHGKLIGFLKKMIPKSGTMRLSRGRKRFR